jgi:ABC-2 type transport system permease protein
VLSFLRDTLLIVDRLIRLTLRMPVWLLMAVVQPIIWVVLFGGLFRAVVDLPGFGATSYNQYLAPGVAMMTALFGSAHSGLALLGDVDRGVLDRMLATPMARAALITGRVIHSGIQVVFQAGIILGVAALRGAELRGGVVGVAVVCFAAACLGGAVAAISNGLALVARRQEIVIAVMNFVLLPMMYLSSMLMSASLMPSWIAAAARWNPVDWAVVAARAGFEGQGMARAMPPLLALASFTLACILFATFAFRAYRRTL